VLCAGTVMAARLSGAEQVVVCEPHPDMREGARAFGATHTVTPDDDLADRLRSLTGGYGADVTIDAVGSEGLLEQAFDATAPGGTIVCVGVPSPSASARVPAARFVREEKYLTGSLCGSSRPTIDIPNLLGLYAGGRLPIDRLITRTYGLDQLEDAFDDLEAGRLRRGVVLMDAPA
jgi:Zn-dependent alcohol dehydrogenase